MELDVPMTSFLLGRSCLPLGKHIVLSVCVCDLVASVCFTSADFGCRDGVVF
jgi:hypothetical protein